VGDGIDDLARAELLGLAEAFDAADLLKAGPILCEPRWQDGANCDAAHLDTTVALVDVLGATQVRRLGALLRRARQGGDDRGGNRRRRRGPIRLRARAGWP